MKTIGAKTETRSPLSGVAGIARLPFAAIASLVAVTVCTCAAPVQHQSPSQETPTIQPSENETDTPKTPSHISNGWPETYPGGTDAWWYDITNSAGADWKRKENDNANAR